VSIARIRKKYFAPTRAERNPTLESNHEARVQMYQARADKNLDLQTGEPVKVVAVAHGEK